MEETPSKIRPFWLIGGAAAFAVVGLCAAIAVCSVTGLIWFTTQKSSNDAQETQVVLDKRSLQTATVAAPINSAPTPLPQVNAPPAPTIALLVPTQYSAPTAILPTTAPDQAVRTYFQLVSQQRYDLTWDQLTDTFKQKFNCCAPNYNYSGYVSWWDSVNYVDFGTVRTVSQNGDRAVVYVELFYVMNTGARSSVDSNPYIALVYDAASGSWRFDDKRAAP